MATFKALVQYKKADGTYNVKIRVTHGQRVHYIATQLFVTDADLTKSKKIKSVKVLEECERIVASMRAKCNDRAAVLQQLSLEEVVALVTDAGQEFRLDFPTFVWQMAGEMKSEGRGGTARQYTLAVKKLVEYLGRPTIDINELTGEKVSGFYRYMLECIPRAAGVYLAMLSHAHREAKMRYNDEDAGIINIPRSPFDRVRKEKTQAPEKKALDASVIRRLMDYDGPRRFAVDMFLLSFYLCGMNLADLYEAKDPVDGYIIYRRKKTRRRSAERSELRIKVPEEALPIIARHKGSGGQLLGFKVGVDSIQSTLSYSFRKLSEEGFPRMTFYSARHSWATIAANDCGVDKYTVHEALAHSSGALAITDVYIKRDFTAVNEANRRVIDFVKSREV